MEKIALRNYSPPTARRVPLQRKIVLRDLLQRKIREKHDIDKIRQSCEYKRLFVTLIFYLHGNSTEEGKGKKDLDNLSKNVLDVLPEYLVSKGTNPCPPGLGLISGSSDEMVFELHCSKEFVNSPEREGLDLEISEFIENPKSD